MNIDQLCASVPLFAGLDADDLRFVLRAAQQIEYATGSRIVQQGQAADCALFIERGYAQVVSALPGGGQTVMAELGPGSVLGEMALLEGGVRSADVIAREPTACLSMERDAFRMLIAQGNRTVQTINHRITQTLCQRLRELNGKILAMSESEPLAPAIAQTAAQRQPCHFNVHAFLRLLPSLRQISAAELDALLRVSQIFDLPRGAALFNAGQAADACYIVLRGALEISRNQAGSHKRIGILGPGRVCGLLALIEAQPHSMSATARESVTLLELPRAAFEQFYFGDTRATLKIQQVINQELLQSLARTNNHLVRLISQARIRNHAQHVRELSRALAAQDIRTGIS